MIYMITREIHKFNGKDFEDVSLVAVRAIMQFHETLVQETRNGYIDGAIPYAEYKELTDACDLWNSECSRWLASQRNAN